MATFSKRKTKDGTRWDALVRRVGYPTTGKSFSSKLEAELWASRTEAKAAGRTLVVASKTTFGDLLDAAREHLKAPKSAPLEYWETHLGAVPVRDISPALIARHRDLLIGAETRSHGHKSVKPRSAPTVKRYLAALSAVYRVGVQTLHTVESNPVALVKKPSDGRHIIRFLSCEERTALLRECKASQSPDLYPAVMLSLSTGLRLGELHAMRKRDIDFEQRWAVLPKTKNGDARGIPLAPKVRDMLHQRAWPLSSDDFLFPHTLVKGWKNALQRAGIARFRWHDLRHSCASALIQNEANLVEVATLLGHRSIATTKKYAHVGSEHTTKLVDRVMGDIE